MKNVNRLKVVLVEQRKTGKWLAEQLGKDPSTVSKWCSNTTQPPLDMLVNIANLLKVDIKELINAMTGNLMSSFSDEGYIY